MTVTTGNQKVPFHSVVKKRIVCIPSSTKSTEIIAAAPFKGLGTQKDNLSPELFNDDEIFHFFLALESDGSVGMFTTLQKVIFG